MSLHPRRREIIDEDKEAIFYLLEEFKIQAPELPIEQVCQLIGGVLNRTEKAVGFPLREVTPPCPDFKPMGEPKKEEPKPAPEAPKTQATLPVSWGDGPISCPKCHATVQPRTSKRTGESYYKCVPCSVFINEDGSTPPAHGMVK
jgi:hypothetical protein